jgi:hypothetical protein
LERDLAGSNGDSLCDQRPDLVDSLRPLLVRCLACLPEEIANGLGVIRFLGDSAAIYFRVFAFRYSVPGGAIGRHFEAAGRLDIVEKCLRQALKLENVERGSAAEAEITGESGDCACPQT